MVRLWYRMLALLALLGAAGATAAIGKPATEMAAGKEFPDATWQTLSASQAGLALPALDRLRDFVRGRGCVVRHGRLVYTWGDAAKRGDVASAAKPWYGHFLLKAVEEQRIPSLDSPVRAFEPRLNSLNAELQHKDRRITWRHFVTQTSGYGVGEAPGSAFDYNDWQMALFWDTLFLRVYRASLATVDEQVLEPLAAALQCEDQPTFLAFGPGDRAGRLSISPRDFARFGLLYLRQGRWRGHQLLGRRSVELATRSPLPNTIPRTKAQPAAMIPGQRTMGSQKVPDDQTDHIGSYSYLWWMNGVDREGRRHWPDAPLDTYGAFGHGGNEAMVVLPSLDLIVSWNESPIENRAMENEALKRLVEAVTSGAKSSIRPTSIPKEPAEPAAAKPLPGQIVADPQHPQWLQREGGAPFFLCGPGDPEGFLYRGTRRPNGTRSGDQAALIRKLGGTGANCLYLIAVRSHGGDGDASQNPFRDQDPAKGVDSRILEQWEEWFAELDQRGIVIYFFFYDDAARVWDTGDRVGPEERAFVREITDRFKHHRNLIWCVAEEYQEAYSATRVRNLAATIRTSDQHQHVIAVHKLHGLGFEEFAGDPLIRQFAVQYNVPTAEALHAAVVTAWRQAQGRYNLNLSEAAEWGTGREDRLKSWACAMGGAYVMALGMDIASTPKSDLEDCGRLVQFFEASDFRTLAPHDELRHGNTQYVLADPGRSYIAYASEGDTLGLKGMSPGHYTLRWFDCVTGRTLLQKGMQVTGEEPIWQRPRQVGSEVAVWITRS